MNNRIFWEKFKELKSQEADKLSQTRIDELRRIKPHVLQVIREQNKPITSRELYKLTSQHPQKAVQRLISLLELDGTIQVQHKFDKGRYKIITYEQKQETP